MTRIAMLTRGRLARPLVDGFSANGCEVSQIESSAASFAGYDYLLMYGPMAPIGRLIEQLKLILDPPPVIFWYTEQMPDPRLPSWIIRTLARARYWGSKWYDGFLARISKQGRRSRIPFPAMGRLRGIGEIIELHTAGLLKIVCTFSQTNKNFLAQFNLPVVEIPIGYHPFFGEQLSLKRDIDVTFLGTLRDSRRRRLISKLEQDLDKLNVHFVIKDGSPGRGYIFDLERTVLLNRTRIMLNIMRQPWDDAVYRFLLAAANGALLLSEPLHNESKGPLKAGEHFVECRLDDFPYTISEYLSTTATMDQVVENANKLIRTELTMERMTGLCLQKMLN